MFVAVIARKTKKLIWNLAYSFRFSPPHPGKIRIPHLREGLTRHMPYFPGTENSQNEDRLYSQSSLCAKLTPAGSKKMPSMSINSVRVIEVGENDDYTKLVALIA